MKSTIFYAQWPGIKEEDLIVETNQLGRIDYKRIYKNGSGEFSNQAIFTKLQGWTVMEQLIQRGREDILKHTKFISSNGKEYTLEKLLNGLDNIEFRK